MRNFTGHGELANLLGRPRFGKEIRHQLILVGGQLFGDAFLQILGDGELARTGALHQGIEKMGRYQKTDRFAGRCDVDADYAPLGIERRATAHARIDIAAEMDFVVQRFFQQAIGTAGNDSEIETEWMAHRKQRRAFLRQRGTGMRLTQRLVGFQQGQIVYDIDCDDG